MRRLIVFVASLAVLVVGYAVWPLLTAFEIKQAIKAGDVTTLERKVQWTEVRASLKESLAVLKARSTLDDGGVDVDVIVRPRGIARLWGRVKAAAAPVMARHMIDTYVSPEGISKLHKSQRSGFLSILQPGKTAAMVGGIFVGENPGEKSRLEQFVSFYKRLEHARFLALGVVELQLADRKTPGRHYIGRLELIDMEWRLASVRVVGTGF